MKTLRQPAIVQPAARRLAAGLLLAGVAAAGVVVALLDALLAPGAGPVWLAGTAILGGVAVRLRHGPPTTCARGPRLQPLQVSCVGLLGLGVQCYHLAGSAAFATAYPLLAAPWLPTTCIVAGVAGLGVLSTFADCRDADLRERV